MLAAPSKALSIRYLTRDGRFRPSEIADMLNVGRPYVSRIRARMYGPVSRLARLDEQVLTMAHELARLRELVEKLHCCIGNSHSN
jgi:Mn-dependent DtxR family transcriptional regulator